MCQQAHKLKLIVPFCQNKHFDSWLTPEDEVTENEEAPVSFEVYQREVCRENSRDKENDKGMTNLHTGTHTTEI